MNRSKKIFVGVALAFFVFLAGIVYDMSRKTTFPGAKPKAKTTTEGAKEDTAKNHLSPKTTTHQP